MRFFVQCAVGLLVSVVGASDAVSQSNDLQDYLVRFRGFLGGMGNSFWPRDSTIPVCFEPDSEDKNVSRRKMVQDAVTSSWSDYVRVRFVFVGDCGIESAGIHLFIRDDRPHTINNTYGKFLNRARYGIYLNTEFKNYGSATCRQNVELCIRATTIHEFGHALGFVHENILPDSPDECFGEQPGSLPGAATITDYDRTSIMNYCNPLYRGNGSLSALDIEGAQRIYGSVTH